MKKEWKGALIGGLIGLIIPIIFFLVNIITCSNNSCGDYFYAIQPLILICIITFIIGLCFGFVLAQEKKLIKFMSIVLFLSYVIVLFLKTINYYSLTTLEQRGQLGTFLIISLIILLIINLFFLILIKLIHKK